LLKKNYVDGAADVAVEIISPESVGHDRGDKFVEYEAAGAREYWLIDPDRQQAEFYVLQKDGRYLPTQLEDGVFRSEIIDGFWLRAEWLWQLPNELYVLRELGVI
jgi:Uma2 family endonuclease